MTRFYGKVNSKIGILAFNGTMARKANTIYTGDVDFKDIDFNWITTKDTEDAKLELVEESVLKVIKILLSMSLQGEAIKTKYVMKSYTLNIIIRNDTEVTH